MLTCANTSFSQLLVPSESYRISDPALTLTNHPWRECVENMQLTVPYVNTVDNYADFFTKALAALDINSDWDHF